jgi:hypothetical protein
MLNNLNMRQSTKVPVIKAIKDQKIWSDGHISNQLITFKHHATGHGLGAQFIESVNPKGAKCEN